MMQSLREMMQSLRASPVFALAVLLTLGLAGLNGLMVSLMALRLEFLLPGPFAQMAHFTEAYHRTHDLTFAFIFVPAVVGMLAQLRRPSKNVAGQVMALIPIVGLVLTLVLTVVLTNNMNTLQPPWVTVGVAALIAFVLHPAGPDFFRSFSVARINWVMLVLVVIAAVPLLAFASTNIELQGTVTDDHASAGHYGFMAAFAFTVIGVGLLASLRPDGWRLTAWVTGLLPALLGLTSVLYPDATSSLGSVWAFTAIAWGVMFVVAAELTKNAESPRLLGSRRATSEHDTRVSPDRGPTTSTSRWLNGVGIIGMVVVLLFVTRTFTGVGGGQAGPGQHSGESDAPPSGVTDQSGGNTPATPTGTSSPLTAAGSTPSSISIVSVSGTEYSFDAPDTIAAGRTTLRFTNEGQDAHELQLMRLNDGVAIHQFMGAFEQGVDAALVMASAEGGVEAIGPGQTAEVTLNLQEGAYVLISLVESPDDVVPDASKRMVKPLTVTAAP